MYVFSNLISDNRNSPKVNVFIHFGIQIINNSIEKTFYLFLPNCNVI